MLGYSLTSYGIHAKIWPTMLRVCPVITKQENLTTEVALVLQTRHDHQYQTFDTYCWV